MLAVIAVLMLVPGPAFQPGWDAAMCFTDRKQWYRQPRHYFSSCEPHPANFEGFCAPFNTRFALRTGPRSTRAECEDVIRQNYPNLWRFRNRAQQPIICDFNVEGPPEEACLADR